MNTNFNYDLLPALLSALAAKSPLVGIPVPGKQPLILNRAKLQAALRGVEPMFVSVEDYGETTRYLRVRGVAPNRIRTNMRMLSIPRTAIRQRGQRAAQGTHSVLAATFWNFCDTKPAAKKSKNEAKLAKLERKIAKLAEEKQRMMRSLRWDKPTTYDEYDRKVVLRWYQGKPQRRDPKFRDPLKRINQGQSRGWDLKRILEPYKPPIPQERYAFLRDAEYLTLREELRGLESIKASLQ